MLYDPAINDFSKDAKVVFFNMLNRELHTNYKLTDLYVSPPQSRTLTANNNKNSMVELLPMGSSGKYGRLVFYYNRADIGVLASKCGTIQSDTATTLVDILPEINNRIKLNLLPTDIIDAPFEMTETGFKATLIPAVNNLLFTGGVVIEVVPHLPVPAVSININTVNIVTQLADSPIAWFHFNIPTIGTLNLNTFNSINADTVMGIYTSDGVKLLDNDDCLTGLEPLASIIELTQLDAGDYYVAIALHENYITMHDTDFNVSASAANFKYTTIVNFNSSFTPNP